MLSSHSVVSSSRTVRPCSPWRGRWIGHWRTTWSTVCYSAPHSQAAEEAIAHFHEQERKRPTPVQRWLSRTRYRCLELKYGVLWGCPSTPHAIHDPPTAPHVCFCQKNWWLAVRRVQMGLNLRRHASALDGRVSAEWRRCPGSMALRPKDSVPPLRRSSAGWMPARIGRLSTAAERRHSVAICKASLMASSMRRVWALRQQTGAKYSAVECTRIGWLLATLLLQHSNWSQQAASEVRRVILESCEVTQGVGDTWATGPTLLRGIWARSRRAGILCWSWLIAHA